MVYIRRSYGCPSSKFMSYSVMSTSTYLPLDSSEAPALLERELSVNCEAGECLLGYSISLKPSYYCLKVAWFVRSHFNKNPPPGLTQSWHVLDDVAVWSCDNIWQGGIRSAHLCYVRYLVRPSGKSGRIDLDVCKMYPILLYMLSHHLQGSNGVYQR
jgi:hypothetical protein